MINAPRRPALVRNNNALRRSSSLQIPTNSGHFADWLRLETVQGYVFNLRKIGVIHLIHKLTRFSWGGGHGTTQPTLQRAVESFPSLSGFQAPRRSHNAWFCCGALRKHYDIRHLPGSARYSIANVQECLDIILEAILQRSLSQRNYEPFFAF